MAASVRVDGLSVRFPDADPTRPAVDDVTLEIAAGEVVALLGPSGCGKSTVLRCVAGLQRPTNGRVLLDDVDVTDVPAHRRGVGLMFQDYALFPHRDVGANVEFGLRMQNRPPAERRARVIEVLALVGLEGWERRSVASLSGGEQQRVALARALAPSPGVLLLDEPLGALDRTLRDRLVPELGELFGDLGATVVHVTHDQGEALALADRVVVMDAGRVAQVATPAELWSRPATASVARVLGHRNVFTGDVAREVGWPTGPQGVLVLPETVRLRSVVDGDPGTARSPGTVSSVVFRGDHSVVSVVLAAGAVLDVSVPFDPRAEPLAVGASVQVIVDPAGVIPLG
jgi:thiamine transport system ATP-binding protein